jgi:hypothetical protein
MMMMMMLIIITEQYECREKCKNGISVKNQTTFKVVEIMETKLHSSSPSCVVTANAAGCTRLFLWLCLFLCGHGNETRSHVGRVLFVCMENKFQ